MKINRIVSLLFTVLLFAVCAFLSVSLMSCTFGKRAADKPIGEVIEKGKYYRLEQVDDLYVYSLLDEDGSVAVRQVVWSDLAPEFTMQTDTLLQIKEFDKDGSWLLSLYDGKMQKLSDGKYKNGYYMTESIIAGFSRFYSDQITCLYIANGFDDGFSLCECDFIPLLSEFDPISKITYSDDRHITVSYKDGGSIQTATVDTKRPISELYAEVHNNQIVSQGENYCVYPFSKYTGYDYVIQKSNGAPAFSRFSTRYEPKITMLSDTLMQIILPTGTGCRELCFYDTNTQILSSQTIENGFFLQGNAMAYLDYDKDSDQTVLYVANIFQPLYVKVPCKVNIPYMFSLESISAIDDTHIQIVY